MWIHCFFSPLASSRSWLLLCELELFVSRFINYDPLCEICRDLDEVLSKKMADVDFDAEVFTLPPPPIVSSYMIVEVQILSPFPGC